MDKLKREILIAEIIARAKKEYLKPDVPRYIELKELEKKK